MFDYIEMFYNRKRTLVRNGMLSPVGFEQQQRTSTEDVSKTWGYSGHALLTSLASGLEASITLYPQVVRSKKTIESQLLFLAMKPNLIYDLGMHVGQDTAFYLKKGFYVVAVEANPELVNRARQRFSGAIASGKLIIEPRGIAASSGQAEFHVNVSNDSWSSFLPEVGGRSGGAQAINVETITTLDLYATYGVPYFLKIDIEGFDHLPLQALRKSATRPRYISVENGGPELRALLVELGYDRFKWVNQRDVPLQRLPFPAREGRWRPHRFEFGASGAFGEEAPGHWMDLHEVEDVIDAYWSTPQLEPSHDGWGDLHARFASN